MALPGAAAPDPPGAEPGAQPVDQGRQGLGPLDGLQQAGQVRLAGSQDLGLRRLQAHRLDAEAGVQGLQPGQEEAGEALRVAGGPGQAQLQPHGGAVHPVEVQAEAPRPAPGRLQPRAQGQGRVPAQARQVVRGADRLGQVQAGEPGGGRSPEGQGLGGPAQGLVQAQHHAGAEAAGQGRPGQDGQLADPPQAQPGQPLHRRRLQPQGGQGQVGQFGREGLGPRPARSQDLRTCRRRRASRQGPGRPGRIGDGDPGGQAVPPQARGQVGGHLRLAAPQVGDPADVEEEAVRRVRGDGGGEAHAPVGQGLQGPGVGLRLGLGQDQAGAQGLGVGHPLAGEEARRRGVRADGGQHPQPPVLADQGEGLSPRR